MALDAVLEPFHEVPDLGLAHAVLDPRVIDDRSSAERHADASDDP